MLRMRMPRPYGTGLSHQETESTQCWNHQGSSREWRGTVATLEQLFYSVQEMIVHMTKFSDEERSPFIQGLCEEDEDEKAPGFPQASKETTISKECGWLPQQSRRSHWSRDLRDPLQRILRQACLLCGRSRSWRHSPGLPLPGSHQPWD